MTPVSDLDPRRYLLHVLGFPAPAADELLRNKFVSDRQRKWYWSNLGKQGGPKEWRKGKTGGGAAKQQGGPLSDVQMKKVREVHGLGLRGSGIGDSTLSALYDARGYHAKPQVATKEEMDRLVAEGHLEMYRGIAAPRSDEYAEQLRTGDTHYPGFGIFGNGTYTAYGKSALIEAADYSYGDSGTVVRMALGKDAKVASFQKLIVEQADELDRRSASLAQRLKSAKAKGEAGLREVKAVQAEIVAEAANRAILEDVGRYAVYRGYDAIDCQDAGVKYMVVLNRGKLIIQAENVGLVENAFEPQPI